MWSRGGITVSNGRRQARTGNGSLTEAAPGPRWPTHTLIIGRTAHHWSIKNEPSHTHPIINAGRSTYPNSSQERGNEKSRKYICELSHRLLDLLVIPSLIFRLRVGLNICLHAYSIISLILLLKKVHSLSVEIYNSLGKSLVKFYRIIVFRRVLLLYKKKFSLLVTLRLQIPLLKNSRLSLLSACNSSFLIHSWSIEIECR